MHNLSFVKLITQKVKEAEKVLIKRYNSETIREEEDITAQLAAEIESRINEYPQNRDIIITAKVFSRRKGFEEKVTGADLGVILDINGLIQKAFLSQAKIGEYNKGHLNIRNRNKLDDQCQKMLSISSDSFIFIYTFHGIFVVPAFGLKSPYLYHKNLRRFFSDFSKCFIGDHKIIGFVRKPESLLEHANHVLYLKIKDYWGFEHE